MVAQRVRSRIVRPADIGRRLPLLAENRFDVVEAALGDREGKPQIYGTQFRESNGELVPEPIDDEVHVDERRARVGLPPLAEYRKTLEGVKKQTKMLKVLGSYPV